MNKKEGKLYFVLGVFLVISLIAVGCDDDGPPWRVSHCINIINGQAEGAPLNQDVFDDGGRSYLCLPPSGYVTCYTDASAQGVEFCDSQDIDTMLNVAVSDTGGGPSLQTLKNANTGTTEIDLEDLGYSDLTEEEQLAVGENVNEALESLEDFYEKSAGQMNAFDFGPINVYDGHSFFLLKCNADTEGFFFEWVEKEASGGDDDDEKQEVTFYGCVLTSSGHFKWLDVEGLQSSVYDHDDDDVPMWFDCDEQDETVFGNFMTQRGFGPEPRAVCGDNKPNTCGIIEDEMSQDDCDINKRACQENCLVAGEPCAWIQTDDNKNNCCGDDLLDDIGAIVQSEQKGGSAICLLDQEELVSTQTNSLPGKDIELDSCEDEWCWIDASGNAKFNIITITKPGETAFDVISNGNGWNTCGPGVAEPTQGDLTSDLVGDINSFQCYQEGNKWNFAECCDPAAGSCKGQDVAGQTSSNGFKVRHAGDSLFALTALLQDNTINVGRGTPYHETYGDDLLDFAGYDYVDIYFSFSAETLDLPTSVIMRVMSKAGILFEDDILPYVINGATLSNNKLLHAKIPIVDWNNVEHISFLPYPAKNAFEIKNVYVTKEGENNPICSGEESIFEAAWIDDLDSLNQDISGQEMCEAQGLTWLGDDVPEPYRCCGDDPEEEAYIGDGVSCYKSQALVEGDTLSEVEFEVTYGLGEWSYEFPTQTISATFEETREIWQEAAVHFKCPSPDDFKPGGWADSQIECDNIAGYNSDELVTDVFDDGGYDVEGLATPGLECKEYVSWDDGPWCVWGYGGFPGWGKWVETRYPAPTSFTIHFKKAREGTQDCIGSEHITVACSLGPYDNTTEELRTDLKYIEGKYWERVEIENTYDFEGEINSLTTPGKIGELTIEKNGFEEGELFSNDDVYLIDPLTPTFQLTTLREKDPYLPNMTYYVMADTRKISRSHEYQEGITETISVTCQDDVCRYPLKGYPPYKIKNLHPEKYSLYFMNEVNGQEAELLIDREMTFYAPTGWVEIREPAKEILFTDDTLISCETEYGEGVEQNLACSTQGGYYCFAGGWRDGVLTKYEYTDNNILQKANPETTIDPMERNASTSIVPGRNLLFNPDLHEEVEE